MAPFKDPSMDGPTTVMHFIEVCKPDKADTCTFYLTYLCISESTPTDVSGSTKLHGMQRRALFPTDPEYRFRRYFYRYCLLVDVDVLTCFLYVCL